MVVDPCDSLSFKFTLYLFYILRLGIISPKNVPVLEHSMIDDTI